MKLLSPSAKKRLLDKLAQGILTSYIVVCITWTTIVISQMDPNTRLGSLGVAAFTGLIVWAFHRLNKTERTRG